MFVFPDRAELLGDAVLYPYIRTKKAEGACYGKISCKRLYRWRPSQPYFSLKMACFRRTAVQIGYVIVTARLRGQCTVK